jgi:hypothetical protein
MSPDYIVQAMSYVESHITESRLCRIENLQISSPNYVVQAMSYVKSHIESRLCSPGYVVCQIADFRVQAMSSFRVHDVVVQAMVCHLNKCTIFFHRKRYPIITIGKNTLKISLFNCKF